MTTPNPRFLLDHHALETTNIDADVEFFQRTMHMRLIRWGSHVQTRRRIALLQDGHAAKIELIDVDQVTGELAHTAFLVEDLATAHQSILDDETIHEIRPPFRLAPAKAECSLLRSRTSRTVQLITYDHDSPDLLPGQVDSSGSAWVY
jgi:hypothetical protein